MNIEKVDIKVGKGITDEIELEKALKRLGWVAPLGIGSIVASTVVLAGSVLDKFILSGVSSLQQFLLNTGVVICGAFIPNWVNVILFGGIVIICFQTVMDSKRKKR